MRHTAYQALRQSAAVIDLTGRGHLQITGEDRARLLHAMTTSHIQELQPGQCRYTLFLNAQGKILGDANVIVTPQSIVLDTEPETADALYDHIDRYIIADDAAIVNATAQIAVIALEGPQSAKVLDQMGIDAPAPDAWVEWRTWMVAGLSVSGEPGARFFVPIEERENVYNWIFGACANEAGRPEWNVVRLEHGRPRYGEDITAREIPHETRLVDKAVSFSKGCYLGQEIVERVRSRGHVNRVLASLVILGHHAPPAHTKLFLDEKEIGEITSAEFSPMVGAVVALGYVRAEVLHAKTPFTFEGGTAAIAGSFTAAK